MADDYTPTKKRSTVRVGYTYRMKITSVDTARSFAVLLKDRIHTVDYIQKIAQTFGDSAPKLKSVNCGDLCMGRYVVDGLWYRVNIREIDAKKGVAEVYFTDFGNIDVCEMATDIRECPARILKFQPQVMECKWVDATKGDRRMQAVINNKLVALSEDDVFFWATVVKDESYSELQMNFNFQDGPVILDMPVLEKTEIVTFKSPEKMVFTTEWVKRRDEFVGSSIDMEKAEMLMTETEREREKASVVAQVVKPATMEADPTLNEKDRSRLLEMLAEKTNIIAVIIREHEEVVKELRKLLLMKDIYFRDKMAEKENMIDMAVEETDQLRILLKEKEQQWS